MHAYAQGAHRKHLLVLSPECYGFDKIEYWGGMGQVAYNVSKRMGDGFDVYLFSRTREDRPVVHKPSGNFTVVGVKPQPFSGGRQEWYACAPRGDCWEAADHWACVRNFITGEGRDLGIDLDDAVAWYHDWFGAFPLLDLAERGVKGAFTYHMSHKRTSEDIAQDARLGLERLAADYIKSNHSVATAVSGCQKQVVGSAYGLPDNKVVVIPNGVDTGVFSPEAARNAGVLEKYGIRKPYVVFSGRPVPEKRPEMLLEAMPHICEARPDMHAVFMFLGRPENNRNRGFWDVYDSEAYGKYRGRIIFTGNGDIGSYIPDNERAAIYANAEVGIFPSDPDIAPEAFGLISPEIQACGKPSVVGRGTGLEETIKQGVTGFAVNPKDSGEIAGAALACMNTPRMGQSARELMEDMFSWDIIAGRYDGLLRSL